MDKYEFNIKVEQIQKLVNKGDYETAMKIADTIDWKKVRNANLLSLVSQVYEKNEEYQDAKDILLLAFERAPIGKRLLYKLTELALKENNLEEAEAYYREFCDLAGDDPRQHLLRYMLLKKMDAPLEQMIHSLESYTSEELDEKWLYELAELYHEAGDEAKCVAACDKIMLMFGLGQYVDKAMELKLQHAALTKYQMDLVENREKYEEKLRAVERGFELADEDYLEDEPAAGADAGSVEDVPTKPAEQYVPEPAEQYVPGAPEPAEVLPDDDLRAEVRQAEVEERLKKELTRMSADTAAGDEDELGKTRILGDIRRAKRDAEPEKSVLVTEDVAAEPQTTAKHLMIEARTPERAMEAAKKILKQLQAESGVKRPVARTTGSKLSQRGVLASAEKLAGKDLLIEEAGDLTAEAAGELEKFILQNHTETRVLLLDNPRQLEALRGQNASLASRFDLIDAEAATAEQPVQNIGSSVVQSAGGSAAEEVPAAVRQEPAKEIPQATEPAADDRPVRRVVPAKDSAHDMPIPNRYVDEPQEQEPMDEEEEMDIDEFAQYACQYAANIDCSITGKSMLALYERIEIMEEDGIKLTPANAEALIEEAADRAEKPSLGKAIKGIFSSKYNKDGLLILKEEHFI